MAIGVLPLVVDSAAPDHTQHLATDINDALSRLDTAVGGVTAALETSISNVAASVTALTAVVGNPGWHKISSQSASTSATVDFTSGIDSTYDRYAIEIFNLAPDTDGVFPCLRISTDNGANWESDASDYCFAFMAAYDNATGGFLGSSIQPQVQLTENMGSAAGKVGSGAVHLFQPSVAALNPHLFKFFVTGSGGGFNGSDGGFRYTTASAINGIRFFMSSGNIATGTFTLYGLTK
jgi:hypothetical protein